MSPALRNVALSDTAPRAGWEWPNCNGFPCPVGSGPCFLLTNHAGLLPGPLRSHDHSGCRPRSPSPPCALPLPSELFLLAVSPSAEASCFLDPARCRKPRPSRSLLFVSAPNVPSPLSSTQWRIESARRAQDSLPLKTLSSVTLAKTPLPKKGHIQRLWAFDGNLLEDGFGGHDPV